MKASQRFKQAFLKKMSGPQPFQELLDLLPDVAFFMKDLKGRFVMHNRRALDYCRVASEEATLGKTDYDFWPTARADIYVAGDRQVMETGEPIINAIAPVPDTVGSDRLIVYSKVAVRDAKGRIIGVAGMHRDVEGLKAPPGRFGKLSKALAHLNTQYAERLTIPRLAAIAGLSRSQFERIFRKVFGSSPNDYLNRVRVSAACRRLETSDDKCTQIALDCGFYDHSHFSRTFKRVMGMPPQIYRRRHLE